MTEAQRFSPAFVASSLLHLGVLAALVLVRPPVGDPAGEGPPVAVRLASSGDLAAAQSSAGSPPATMPAAEPPNPEAGLAAPELTSRTPPPSTPITPAAKSPVLKSPPSKPPVVQPTPPGASPTPQSTAAKPAMTSTRSPSSQTRSSGGLDLDALASQVARLGARMRSETASTSGAAAGPSASALAGLQDQLQRRWTPNCEVEGARDVRVRVSFRLGVGGDLAGPVEAGGLEQSENAVVRAAAERAIRAVHQAAPFPALAGSAGQRIAVNFNAQEACS